jgi:hypothetical protein
VSKPQQVQVYCYTATATATASANIQMQSSKNHPNNILPVVQSWLAAQGQPDAGIPRMGGAILQHILQYIAENDDIDNDDSSFQVLDTVSLESPTSGHVVMSPLTLLNPPLCCLCIVALSMSCW